MIYLVPGIKNTQPFPAICVLCYRTGSGVVKQLDQTTTQHIQFLCQCLNFRSLPEKPEGVPVVCKRALCILGSLGICNNCELLLEAFAIYRLDSKSAWSSLHATVVEIRNACLLVENNTCKVIDLDVLRWRSVAVRACQLHLERFTLPGVRVWRIQDVIESSRECVHRWKSTPVRKSVVRATQLSTAHCSTTENASSTRRSNSTRVKQTKRRKCTSSSKRSSKKKSKRAKKKTSSKPSRRKNNRAKKNSVTSRQLSCLHINSKQRQSKKSNQHQLKKSNQRQLKKSNQRQLKKSNQHQLNESNQRLNNNDRPTSSINCTSTKSPRRLYPAKIKPPCYIEPVWEPSTNKISKWYYCTLCRRTLKLFNLDSHVQHHGIGLLEIKCQECPKKFELLSVWERHCEIYHFD